MASQRRRLQKGVSLLVGTASMVLLIPSAGLAVDAALLYYTKARIQGAVDGAALAAARSLSLGATTAAQSTSAKQNAVNWFYANFPTTMWGTSNTQMDQSTVQVFDDPNNSNLRNVTVSANTTVPTIFMRWFNMNTTLVAALGNASRRDVVIMMVLDRSGSMKGPPDACPSLKSAAKIFTGQFAAGRDRIGMLSFSDGVYVHQSPTTDFRNQLGYDDGITVGNGTGNAAIDSIDCDGGTGTPQAISVGYNELYKTNLPGALNILLVETDGAPNTLALNFGWDTTTNASAITGNGCKDANNKAQASAGWGNSGAQRLWQPTAHSMGPNGYFADIPAGAYGSLYSSDPGAGNYLWSLINPWHTDGHQGWALSGANGSTYADAVTPGCLFIGGNHQNNTDFAWIPPKDIFGNSLKPSIDPYLTVTTTSGRVDKNWSNFHNAAINTTIDAGYRARTNANLPATIFVVGLGGNASYPPEYTMLQRIANDPGGDDYSGQNNWNPCPQQTGCVNYPSQPQGKFIWSVDRNELAKSFQDISAQILRLSK